MNYYHLKKKKSFPYHFYNFIINFFLNISISYLESEQKNKCRISQHLPFYWSNNLNECTQPVYIYIYIYISNISFFFLTFLFFNKILLIFLNYLPNSQSTIQFYYMTIIALCWHEGKTRHLDFLLKWYLCCFIELVSSRFQSCVMEGMSFKSMLRPTLIVES